MKTPKKRVRAGNHRWVILARRVNDGQRDYELSVCSACCLRRRVRLTDLKYQEYLPKDVSGWQHATRAAGRCPVKVRRNEA